MTMTAKNPPKISAEVVRQAELAADAEYDLNIAVAKFVESAPNSRLRPEIDRLSTQHAELQQDISNLLQRNSELTMHLWEERKAARNHAELCRVFHAEIASVSRRYSSEQKQNLRKLEKVLEVERKTAEAYLFVLERAFFPAVKACEPGRGFQMVHNVKGIFTGMVDKCWAKYREIIR